MNSVMVFTPTWTRPDGTDAIERECSAMIQAQVLSAPFEWIVGYENPHRAPDDRNVLAQYKRARKLFLASEHTHLLTLEHDMVLPDEGAVQRMLETALGTTADLEKNEWGQVDVVYAPYMLRHGAWIISTWKYVGAGQLGPSLTDHPAELQAARDAVVWRVCGVGFGCTLFTRRAIERIPFSGGNDDLAHCPDLPFALHALQAGLVSVGRFDVPVGHLERGDRLEPYGAPGGEYEHFRVREWAGLPQWLCRHCAYDTLQGEGVMREHVRARHPGVQSNAPTGVQLNAPTGSQLNDHPGVQLNAPTGGQLNDHSGVQLNAPTRGG